MKDEISRDEVADCKVGGKERMEKAEGRGGGSGSFLGADAPGAGRLGLLLDGCLDWRLRRDLPGQEVKSVQEMGWEGIKTWLLPTERSSIAPHFRCWLRP